MLLCAEYKSRTLISPVEGYISGVWGDWLGNFPFFCHTLHSVPPNPFGEATGSTGSWGQCILVWFCCSFLLTYSFPLLQSEYSTGYRPQSLLGCPCSGVTYSWAAILSEVPPSAWSTSFQECISSHVLNNVIFHVSPLFHFSKCISSHFPSCVPLCVSYCFSSHVSFLCLLKSTSSLLCLL